MQENPGTPRLDQLLSPQTVATLAEWYDRAVNALDPHSADRAEAERILNEELRGLYDMVR